MVLEATATTEGRHPTGPGVHSGPSRVVLTEEIVTKLLCFWDAYLLL